MSNFFGLKMCIVETWDLQAHRLVLGRKVWLWSPTAKINNQQHVELRGMVYLLHAWPSKFLNARDHTSANKDAFMVGHIGVESNHIYLRIVWPLVFSLCR